MRRWPLLLSAGAAIALAAWVLPLIVSDRGADAGRGGAGDGRAGPSHADESAAGGARITATGGSDPEPGGTGTEEAARGGSEDPPAASAQVEQARARLRSALDGLGRAQTAYASTGYQDDTLSDRAYQALEKWNLAVWESETSFRIAEEVLADCEDGFALEAVGRGPAEPRPGVVNGAMIELAVDRLTNRAEWKTAWLRTLAVMLQGLADDARADEIPEEAAVRLAESVVHEQDPWIGRSVWYAVARRGLPAADEVMVRAAYGGDESAVTAVSHYGSTGDDRVVEAVARFFKNRAAEEEEEEVAWSFGAGQPLSPRRPAVALLMAEVLKSGQAEFAARFDDPAAVRRVRELWPDLDKRARVMTALEIDVQLERGCYVDAAAEWRAFLAEAAEADGGVRAALKFFDE